MPRRTPKQATTPYYVPSKAPRKRFEDMDAAELQAYMVDLRGRLATKQQRERAYLDRRAARGTRTPTDEAYENDQLLESELLALLDHILQST